MNNYDNIKLNVNRRIILESSFIFVYNKSCVLFPGM